MKLTRIGILGLRGLDRETRLRIAAQAGIKEDKLYRWIRTNDERLTMVSLLTVIKDELGLTEDQLLEPSTKVQPQAA